MFLKKSQIEISKADCEKKPCHLIVFKNLYYLQLTLFTGPNLTPGLMFYIPMLRGHTKVDARLTILTMKEAVLAAYEDSRGPYFIKMLKL